MKLTEDLACGYIMDIDRVRRGHCMPRYTPSRWWECDVFELTASGYFREYEVKLTLADFRQDKFKQQDIRGTGRWEDVPEAEAKFKGQTRWVTDTELKYHLLAKGDSRGPSQFWYVAPEGLIPREELPQWAGLMELRQAGDRYYLQEPVKAPKLHKEKCDPAVKDHMLSCCYYRLHDIWRKQRMKGMEITIPPESVASAEEYVAMGGVLPG